MSEGRRSSRQKVKDEEGERGIDNLLEGEKKHHPRLTPNKFQIQMKKKDEEEDPIRSTLTVVYC